MRQYGAALAICLLTLSGCKTPEPAKPAKPAATPPTTAVYIGEITRPSGTEFVITHAGSTSKQPKILPGGELVLVEYKVKNVGKTPIPVSNLPYVRLVDDNNVVYNADVGWTALFEAEKSVSRNNVSELSPGLEITGAVAFEVAQSKFDTAKWHLVAGEGFLINLCSRNKLVDGHCPTFNNAV